MKQNKNPNLFIVGKPKSGTTGMYWLLKQHPEVFMSERKEPHFFIKQNPDEKQKQDYLDLFPKAKNEKYLGEASVNYIFRENTAKRIKQFNPDSKIMIMLREPVDFLMSWYQHINFKKQEKEKPSFEEFINKKNNKERLKYSKQIKRYLREFPKKNIHIIIYKDFKKDNLREYKKVCRFLIINEKFKPATSQRNPRKVKRKNLVSKILQKLPLYKIQSYIEKRFSPKIKNKLVKIGFNLVYKKEKWEIDNKTKSKLKKQIKPEVKKLSNLLHKEGFLSKNRDLIKEWNYENV